MDKPKLTRSYLLGWLENYALEGGTYVNEYVNNYLSDRYFNAQLTHLKRKHKGELRKVILSEIYKSGKKTITKMLENSNTDTLVKIILSMQNSLGRGSDLDDIVNPPREIINDIFINFIQDLPVDRLKEIVALFLTHEGYLDEEDEEEDWTEGSEISEEEEVRVIGVKMKEKEVVEGEIREYFVHVSDDVLLERMRKYNSNLQKL